uniref:Uncharacterized protein n=1 Tax=Noctiluca scintillans TaxID=2966 RepID=A0A7S1A4U6_NOCSC|mmetsp:Transcript_31405/g.83569  ORF Transcript_31405/g.83569 Transcript_31405/m.83569 type:complete len:999 (+) Transcript_31405:53-3049(+)
MERDRRHTSASSVPTVAASPRHSVRSHVPCVDVGLHDLRLNPENTQYHTIGSYRSLPESERELRDGLRLFSSFNDDRRAAQPGDPLPASFLSMQEPDGQSSFLVRPVAHACSASPAENLGLSRAQNDRPSSVSRAKLPAGRVMSWEESLLTREGSGASRIGTLDASVPDSRFSPRFVVRDSSQVSLTEGSEGALQGSRLMPPTSSASQHVEQPQDPDHFSFLQEQRPSVNLDEPSGQLFSRPRATANLPCSPQLTVRSDVASHDVLVRRDSLSSSRFTQSVGVGSQEPLRWMPLGSSLVQADLPEGPYPSSLTPTPQPEGPHPSAFLPVSQSPRRSASSSLPEGPHPSTFFPACMEFTNAQRLTLTADSSDQRRESSLQCQSPAPLDRVPRAAPHIMRHEVMPTSGASFEESSDVPSSLSGKSSVDEEHLDGYNFAPHTAVSSGRVPPPPVHREGMSRSSPNCACSIQSEHSAHQRSGSNVDASDEWSVVSVPRFGERTLSNPWPASPPHIGSRPEGFQEPVGSSHHGPVDDMPIRVARSSLSSAPWATTSELSLQAQHVAQILPTHIRSPLPDCFEEAEAVPFAPQPVFPIAPRNNTHTERSPPPPVAWPSSTGDLLPQVQRVAPPPLSEFEARQSLREQDSLQEHCRQGKCLSQFLDQLPQTTQGKSKISLNTNTSIRASTGHEGTALIRREYMWRYVILGMILTTALMCLPLLNACILLLDMNYVFWLGLGYPLQVICICISGIAFLGLTVFALHAKTAAPDTRFQYALASTASCFLALFGILFILAGVREAGELRNVQLRLQLSCVSTDPTMSMLADYSQVLQNMRSEPECAASPSVENCPGWAENRYTNYLRYLEQHMACGPVCGEGGAVLSTSFVQPHTVTPRVGERLRPHPKRNRELQRSVSTLDISRVPAQWKGMPKLFDEGFTKMPCTPLVASRLEAYSWCFGDMLFWQGYFMIFGSAISVFLTFLDFWRHGNRSYVGSLHVSERHVTL